VPSRNTNRQRIGPQVMTGRHRTGAARWASARRSRPGSPQENDLSRGRRRKRLRQSNCRHPAGESAGGIGSGMVHPAVMSPGGLHHLPAVDQDHRSRSRGDMSQTVGGQPGRRATAARIHVESAATLSLACRKESTAPAETVTTVAAQPVSPPGGSRPEIRVHDGLHRFPSPTSRNRGRGHQRKAAFRGSGGPHRPALMLLALDSFSRHSCSVAGDSDGLTWCRTGFPGCCRRSPAAGCIWRRVHRGPGHRS